MWSATARVAFPVGFSLAKSKEARVTEVWILSTGKATIFQGLQ